MRIRPLAPSPRRPLPGLLSVCAVLCGALAACGGGDDGSHDGTTAPDAARSLTVDASYGTQGHTVLPLGTAGTDTAAIAVTQLQPDGKLLLAGWRRTPTADQAAPLRQNPSSLPTQAVVWRLNADGSPDTSFGQGGHVTIGLQGKNAVDHLRWTPDGIVLALSLFEPCTPAGQDQCLDPSGTPVFPKAALVRLDERGALDPRFGRDGVAEAPYGRPSALAVQPDGHILWLNSISHPRGSLWGWNLQRYTPGGTVDTTFNQGRPLASQCKSNGGALALLPDGRILASGDRAAIYANPAQSPGLCLEAVRPDGQRDPGFANGQPLWLHAGANAVLKSLHVNAHGHITLTARTQDAAGICAFNASRLTTSGQLDSRFGRGGTARLPLRSHAENTVCVLDASLHTAQGHTVMVGRRWGQAMQETVWTRLTPDGRPDAAFGPNGIHATPEPGMAHLLRDTKGRWLSVDITTGAANDGPVRARITRLMGESG